ncbi:MAG: VWA domain-containing protein [Symploca sp. SIO2E6]|nr:VWA domain-containing protein [Symploca sp. SIO2E6]
MSLPEECKNRSYTLLLDKSGSMNISDQTGGMSRWDATLEAIRFIIQQFEKIDYEGINVYTFAGKVSRPYRNVNLTKFEEEVLSENQPVPGRTNLTEALRKALDDYFERKLNNLAKPNGEIILVITDGKADDPKGVRDVIIEASKKIDRDEEIGISLIQVGQDEKVKKFFKELDDDLVNNAGAKFDICDTLNFEDLEDYPLAEVLLNAIKD